MELDAYDYHLPPSAIAQTPAQPRGAARLLRIERASGRLEDRRFAELPGLLRAGDCVVVNDSRVIAARVFAADARRRPVELLFVEPLDDGRWRALVRPGGRALPEAELSIGDGAAARLRVLGVEADGARVVERLDGDVPSLLAEHGLPPLPPYIASHARPSDADRERYQTVYARSPGSIAAPTAGLHFERATLDALAAHGIEVRALTLHVGVATFRPLRVRTLAAHRLPPERADIPEATASAVVAARRERRRVVAVGTTTTRALESAAAAEGCVLAGPRPATLTIAPGYRFRVVDALVTNFHLPRSSLLVLVAAFAGRDLVLRAYRHAVAAGYRFYSYGDTTLIE